MTRPPLASNPNPSTLGQSATFTATVTSGGSPTTQGSVAFKESATVLAGPTALNSSGQASFSASTLSGGSHTIVAEYNGNGNFNVSSGNVTHMVNNTPTGTNVALIPRDPGTGKTPATLTFTSVTRGGETTLVIGSSGAEPPSSFKRGNPSTYYDLSTTALFTGKVGLCINYAGMTFDNEAQIRLFRFEGGGWVDVTTSVDTNNDTICGSTTSLSPFAIFEPAAKPAIAVTNQNDDTVSIIDPETNQVVDTVEVGHKPVADSFFDVFFEAFTSPAKLYVAQRESKGKEGHGDNDDDEDDDEDGGKGTVEVLVGPASPTPANAFDFSSVKTIQVGKRPEGLAIKPDGSQIWVANRNDDTLSIIDRATEIVIATVPLKKNVPSKGKGKGSQEIKIGQKPVAIGFSPDGLYAYVVGRNSNNLIVLDTAKAITDSANAIVGYVDVGNKPVALAVSATSGLVYVANRSGKEVAVVDVNIPASPVVRAKRTVGEEPEGLALLHDGSKLYVTNSESNTVSVLQVQPSPTYLALIKTVPVGQKPSGIALTPPGTFDNKPFAYVANREDNTVSVIDTTIDQVIATIPVGKGPKGVAAGLLPTAP